MKFHAILLASILITSLVGLSNFDDAFAQLEKQGMAVTVTANEGSSKILVSGETSKVTPIAIIVTDPNGNIIHRAQVSPDRDGNFMAEINVGGNQWKFDGIYTITTQHGENTLYTIALPVEVVGGKTLATNVSEDFLENIVFSGSTVSQVPPTEQSEPEQRIPDWVRNIFVWYGDGLISEDELINALQFLIQEGTIEV